MRSQDIQSPWHNRYYQENITSFVKFDSYTFAITGSQAKPEHELHYYYGIKPTPKHFHQLTKQWVTDYQWQVEPVTGAYQLQLSQSKAGKRLHFQRLENWWGNNQR